MVIYKVSVVKYAVGRIAAPDASADVLRAIRYTVAY
jgi:hypothetical protein